MAIDLVICDCDGVLVDSEVLACKADAEELGRRGFNQYTLEEVLRRFAGVSQADMIALIEQETGRSLGDDFGMAVAHRVEKALSSELVPLSGAAEVLREISALKCVASSSTPKKLDLALSVTGLKPLFQPHIFSSTLVRNGKPAPDLFFYAAEQMNVPPHRCCVIEDSVAGVKAAIAANMPVIGFVGGSHCSADQSDRLRQVGAVTIVREWTQIPKALSELQ